MPVDVRVPSFLLFSYFSACNSGSAINPAQLLALIVTSNFMTTDITPLPTDLTIILDSLEYQENGGLVITCLNFTNENLRVFFTLSYGDNQLPQQFWTLDVFGIKKEKVSTGWTVYPEIYSDHFLLYDLTDDYVELYFNGNTENPEKLFCDLYKSHTVNYDNNLEFGYGINAPNGMLKLCTNDCGLFARGARRILAEYERCLKSHGIRTNYLNEVTSEDKDLKLLIFGESYFIGKDFKFSRAN